MYLTLIKNYKLSVILFLLITVFICSGFSMGGSEQKAPIKPYSAINIPDGTFLRYGNYVGGEKTYDLVFVIRQKKDENGKLLYYIYSDYVPVSGNKKPSEDYTKWSTFYVIDMTLGSVLEAEQQYSTDKAAMENKAKYGMGDVVYTHFKLHRDKGYVEYITKSLKDNKLKETKYKVSVKSDLAIWESAVSMFFGPTFMNFDGGGLMYVVVPQLLREPLPNTYKVITKETIQTPAGTFKANKLEGILADPFLGKLLDSVIKGGGYWVEDSDRRLVVKITRSASGDGSVLEEISSVKVQ